MLPDIIVDVIKSGDFDELKKLGINTRHGDDRLHIAARYNSLELIKKMTTKCDVDVKVCDSHDNTPLHEACGMLHAVLAMSILCDTWL